MKRASSSSAFSRRRNDSAPTFEEIEMKFHDKTVLVTGAASGIGFATARRFAEAGARVLLTDVNAGQGATAAAELKAEDLDVHFLELDITDRIAVEALAA